MLTESKYCLTEQLVTKLAVPCETSYKYVTVRVRAPIDHDDFENFLVFYLKHVCDVVHTHWRGSNQTQAQRFQAQLASDGWYMVNLRHTGKIYQYLWWLVQNCQDAFSWIPPESMSDHDQCGVWFQNSGEAAFFKIHSSQ